ncbi:hypothetical protein DPMN_095342 [Dreissena polymorpha]|uniref:Uncharacterized protein n=1 Tax=Dreissena polymorpha TaxID=45954 RepID=A0A9D4L959_DREPO|nr:hypothetical protein DPMN_095342 [Dreissena polymorpha]
MRRVSTGMKRGKLGLHWESIKMFNTSGMNRESTDRTGSDRRGTENNRDGNGNNRDGTVALPGPIQTPVEVRQRGKVKPRCMPTESRYSYGT